MFLTSVDGRGGNRKSHRCQVDSKQQKKTKLELCESSQPSGFYDDVDIFETFDDYQITVFLNSCCQSDELSALTTNTILKVIKNTANYVNSSNGNR